MKIITATALLALAMGAMQANAADYGIGVSVQSNDSIIYAPIELNDQFRLEPSLRYLKDEIDLGGGVELEQESLELGIGAFGMSAVNKSVRFYYGGRVTYVDQEFDQRGLVSASADGFRISPTIGFEFLFNERLSLAGEAEYFFQDIDSDDIGDTETSGTDTRLILRFKF